MSSQKRKRKKFIQIIEYRRSECCADCKHIRLSKNDSPHTCKVNKNLFVSKNRVCNKFKNDPITGI